MASCVRCDERLVFANDDGAEVPDDLQLPCGCHFHWECLFEDAVGVVASLRCPSCGRALAATGQPGASSSSSSSPAGAVQILTHYTNESGLQPHYDVYPRLAEEAYYATRPGLLPGRAFVTMCGEGDVEGVVGLYLEASGAGGDDEMDADDDGDEAPAMQAPDLLRYQDPLNNMESGLHVAIANDRLHIALLLLYLASRVPLEQFPPDLVQYVASVPRPEETLVAYPDIRTLQTALGETAEAYALKKGGSWADMAQKGFFACV